MTKLRLSYATAKLHPKLRPSLQIILISTLFIQMITLGARDRVAKAFAQQQSQACPSCQMPAEDHFLNFAYFVESGDLTSTLVLNNNTGNPQNVRLTIFNHQGDLFQLPPFSLPAQQVSRFSLHDLLKGAKGDFNSGNLQVFYHAMGMGVTGQVTVTSAKHRYSFDSYPTEAMMFASTRMDGILWLPDKRAEARVALTNTASTALTVTISSGQDPQKQEKNIDLNPRETKVVNLREFVAEPVRGPSATLLSLTHNGAPGDLITTGFALNNKNGFASNLLFVDRATATSNKLAGAHVRIGQVAASDGFPAGTTFSAPLVVANPSDLPSEVRVAVDYTIDAAPHRVELTPFTLAAQEIKQIDLAQELAQRGVSGPVDEAGVDLNYSGHAGAVIGRLTSVDGSGDYSFDVPIKDPLAGMNRVGGSYPWRLDQDYNTVLHLKNTTDKEVKAIVQIRYEGGNYNPELLSLAPYQTIALDIRKLRDDQKPDIRKGVIPREIASGKVVWFEEEIGSLIGRAEVFNVGIGVANSFSCPSGCTCPPVYDSSYMSPSSYNSVVGDVDRPFAPMQMKRDCLGQLYGPYDMSSSINSWISTDTSVATVSSGTVACVGVGSASIVAYFTAVVGYGAPGVPCEPHYANLGTPGALQVVDYTLTFSQNDINPTSTGGSSTSTVIVQTNPATQGLSVNLSVNEITDSGGHINHSGTRPLGTLSATQGTTDPSGAFQTTYTSPIFGGAVTIHASVATTRVDRAEIMRVGVPGLSLLGAGTNYNLRQVDPYHGDYHYGTAAAVASLPNIADAYKAEYYGTGAIPNDDKLIMNDMSLINGGKFEIPGNWSATADHQEHRLGTNCDLLSNNVPQARWARLNEIFLANGVNNVLDETATRNHWHLRY